MRHFYSLDGEAIILKELFDESVLDELATNNIDVGKISKSDTGNHQASDRSPVFRDCKTGMKTVTNNTDINYKCSLIGKNVKAIIKEFNDSKEFPKECKISTKNSAKIVDACQKISFARIT